MSLSSPVPVLGTLTVWARVKRLMAAVTQWGLPGTGHQRREGSPVGSEFAVGGRFPAAFMSAGTSSFADFLSGYAPSMLPVWEERWGPVATPLLWSHAAYLILADELGERAG